MNATSPMKADYSPIWKQADKAERTTTAGLDQRIYDKFRNFSTLMIVRKMEQAGPNTNLDDETHEITARLMAIDYDWHWDMNQPNNAIKPVACKSESGPKSLPWPERVAMLSINPDAATSADVAQLASELINCHQQDAMADRLEWQDWERWSREVLTDFKIPFDNHKVGMRQAITQWMADKLNCPGAICEIGVTDLGKVSVLLTNQELEDIFVALENYSWSQERKQRCRAIILRIRPYLQRQVDEIRFGESGCKL